MDLTKLHGKARKLYDALEDSGIDPEDVLYIMQGADEFPKRDRGALRAFFAEAMDRMDERMPSDVKRQTREACACCKTGPRQKLARAIYAEHDTFASRLAALAATPEIVGHTAYQLPDGRVRVVFAESAGDMQCPCLPVGNPPLSLTYCMCCGGQVKHHLQIALGVRAVCTVVQTLQCNQPPVPCVFDYTLEG